MADSSISEVKKILENIKEQLVKANTSTTTNDGLTAIASSIAGLKENLFQLANTQVENEYVFAGSNSSVKPFEKDASGKVTYLGNSQLRKVAIEEGSYRERGITGFDMMMYPSSTAYQTQKLTFKETDRIIDQDGNEWKFIDQDNLDADNNLNTNVEKNKLYKFDLDGNLTTDTPISVNYDATTNTYTTASAFAANGTKFEAKTNIFDLIDTTVNALKKLDSSGNPISAEDSRTLVAKYQGEVDKAYDSVNIAHANLGGKNKIFEISLERVSSKLTQFDILSRNLGSADLAQVAIESKALELTYTALYSTINHNSTFTKRNLRFLLGNIFINFYTYFVNIFIYSKTFGFNHFPNAYFNICTF
jgi:flagellar hook-associated protein 3 FlgL